MSEITSITVVVPVTNLTDEIATLRAKLAAAEARANECGSGAGCLYKDALLATAEVRTDMDSDCERGADTMTREQKIAILTTWQERMRACESATTQLVSLTGAAPESPLIDAIYSVMGLATRQAADLIGCSDQWLSAWWLEHQFGLSPMRAGLEGLPLRDICTIDDLFKLICDDEAAQ